MTTLLILIACWCVYVEQAQHAIVFALLAIACAVLRLRDGWLRTAWRRNVDEQRDSLFSGE